MRSLLAVEVVGQCTNSVEQLLQEVRQSFSRELYDDHLEGSMAAARI